MLVLTRRVGEAIAIGPDVVVTILEVRGGQVRLGVDAPRDLEVHRAETQRQVVVEGRAALADVETVVEAIHQGPMPPP